MFKRIALCVVIVAAAVGQASAADLFTFEDGYTLSLAGRPYTYAFGASPSSQLSVPFTGYYSSSSATFGANDTPALTALTNSLLANDAVSSKVTIADSITSYGHGLTYPDTTGMNIQQYVVITRMVGHNTLDTFWQFKVRVLGTGGPVGAAVPEPSTALMLLGLAPMLWRRVR